MPAQLDIRGNSQLTSMRGLKALAKIEGPLSITDNAKLTSLDGLQKLRDIGGNINIWRNAELSSVSALQAVQKPTTISVFGNPNLQCTSLCSLCSRHNCVGGDFIRCKKCRL